VKADTRTGLMRHRETLMRDACISDFQPVVGMSATVRQRDTTYANSVRCFFSLLLLDCYYYYYYYSLF